MSDVPGAKRLVLTVTVEYWADPDNYVQGGEVPDGLTLEEYMCEIDASNFEDDPALIADTVDLALADDGMSVVIAVDPVP